MWQRTSRHKLFTPAVVGATGSDAHNDTSGSDGTKKYQLKCIDFLLGTTTKLDNVICLGMIAQIKHAKYSLEDPTGCVDLDLAEAKFHRGLYTENCFVLIEGRELYVLLSLGNFLVMILFPSFQNENVS